jgi:hypothetical protein
MTAAFGATRGTDKRFTDALSGSDGTADPSVTMPVLDVYPDALSAPMPNDLVPVVIPLAAPPAAGVRTVPPEVRAEPVTGRPAPGQRGRAVVPRAQGQQRGAQRSPAPRTATPARPIPPASAMPARSIPPRPPVQPYRPIGPVRPQSFQSTHAQAKGSAAPAAVAPAAPMASQYGGGRGQARSEARQQSQERRRTAVPSKRRSSSVGAVFVFIVVILFATGLGQKIIDLVTELLNR